MYRYSVSSIQKMTLRRIDGKTLNRDDDFSWEPGFSLVSVRTEETLFSQLLYSFELWYARGTHAIIFLSSPLFDLLLVCNHGIKNGPIIIIIVYQRRFTERTRVLLLWLRRNYFYNIVIISVGVLVVDDRTTSRARGSPSEALRRARGQQSYTVFGLREDTTGEDDRCTRAVSLGRQVENQRPNYYYTRIMK